MIPLGFFTALFRPWCLWNMVWFNIVMSLEHVVFLFTFTNVVYRMFYCLFHFICFRFGEPRYFEWYVVCNWAISIKSCLARRTNSRCLLWRVTVGPRTLDELDRLLKRPESCAPNVQDWLFLTGCSKTPWVLTPNWRYTQDRICSWHTWWELHAGPFYHAGTVPIFATLCYMDRGDWFSSGRHAELFHHAKTVTQIFYDSSCGALGLSVIG